VTSMAPLDVPPYQIKPLISSIFEELSEYSGSPKLDIGTTDSC
jgi:hypothetical protein